MMIKIKPLVNYIEVLRKASANTNLFNNLLGSDSPKPEETQKK